ncbi:MULTISPECIES: H-NS family nucleoid-associated regulatory protein [Burkholderiaceae]|uniref:H-NS family nucleoid-associated regulatory protein n=1 Tax=Burkholderiaceae TaxID=119060 RepID=UPI00074B42E0|nr:MULTISPECIES: H-NS family nucleoid-associated regulatory protein [Burkholderiaceae]SAL80905.1 histone family protein nucleoid-structuring protein H-NS [Caballeronia peredens]
MVTLKSLKNKIAHLQAQAKVIAQKESASIIAKIHALMDDHEITVEDLASYKRETTDQAHSSVSPSDATRKGSVARYRDPKSGATWSGHGRAPGWIANAKNRDKFLFDGDSSAVAPAKKAVRAGNYPRGPQPSKYRDPASGAEWSGRGKAPSWLASAKDRTAFLIDAPGQPASQRKSDKHPASTTRSVSAKKIATKKVAAKKAPSAVKSTSASKTAAKTAAKKTAAGKTATKKSAAKTVTAKAPAKKSASKKAASKNAVAKKTSASTPPTVDVAPQASGSTVENITS